MNDTFFNKPFSRFAPYNFGYNDILIKKINNAYRRSEKECINFLLKDAIFDNEKKYKIANTSKLLVEILRKKRKKIGIESIIQEYSISSNEGIALMCLAEAFLRIPDINTKNDLLNDIISRGNWKNHIGDGRSLFINATTWGIILTGKIINLPNNIKLYSILSNIIKKLGNNIIHKILNFIMKSVGERFVLGETIEEALKKSKVLEKKGFKYSYDILGEEAITSEDAEIYFSKYEHAIHKIGESSKYNNIYENSGISIKLSALHPRYTRSHIDRVIKELIPRVEKLAIIAQNYNIGLNIDAEESSRLNISLNILESLCLNKIFQGWDGIGFVVQAYGRRCPFVIDFLIDLAKRSNNRIMVRLVKGAYWDSEIKSAQVDGLESYPVYTHKVYTDISYIACAKKMLKHPNEIFPQFATHNAQTLSTIYHMVENDYNIKKIEFQCLHGMGETLYNEVIDKKKLNVKTRIYAPVGTHNTLLSYLVRRLLENGANSSFVNQIANNSIDILDLIKDPADVALSFDSIGAENKKISSPKKIFYPNRINSSGFDISNELTLQDLSKQMQKNSERLLIYKNSNLPSKKEKIIYNPSDKRDIVGKVFEATNVDINIAIENAKNAILTWKNIDLQKRCKILERSADLIQENAAILLAIIIRESGKSIVNSIAEIREAIDFIRFYSSEALKTLNNTNYPLGLIVSISPWNFPLSIFVGQISAALVTGNVVIAKPAEETPLIASECVRIFHESGIPHNVLQIIIGNGDIGENLVNADETVGIIFTGSIEVAHNIQKNISNRITKDGNPIILIAETGGQNAMIADSSALAEQIVKDVISSAFDTAGQRCSALRVLYLQEEIADNTIHMLKGAMNELSIGRTDYINNDIGPVINKKSKDLINSHINNMKKNGYAIYQSQLNLNNKYGNFISPTIIEIDNIKILNKEIFGPVLHIIRYKYNEIDSIINDINETGYGLTFGLHTRINSKIDYIISKINSGNIYINRNIIGAVVGSQPFGGRGFSGTGPKAGGFLYIGRLVTNYINNFYLKNTHNSQIVDDFLFWNKKYFNKLNIYKDYSLPDHSYTEKIFHLSGPVGEENKYILKPCGYVLLFPETLEGLFYQIISCLITRNYITIVDNDNLKENFLHLPKSISKYITWTNNWKKNKIFATTMIEGDGERLKKIQREISDFSGPLITMQSSTLKKMRNNINSWSINLLFKEVSISINTSAIGGNTKIIDIY